MKTVYKKMKILFGGICVLAAVCGFGQVDQRPTLENVQHAWNAPYEYPYEKFTAVSRFISQMNRYRSSEIKEDVVMAEEYLLSEILKTPVAAPRDDRNELATGVYWMGMYLRKMADWTTISQSTNILMRIADKVGDFRLLDDLSQTDALSLAHKLDSYVDGTNKQSRSIGMISGLSSCKPWFGPAGLRVAKIMDFRCRYNQSVRSMREIVLRRFYVMIMNGPSDLSNEAKLSLWHEFARRAKASPNETSRAESK